MIRKLSRRALVLLMLAGLTGPVAVRAEAGSQSLPAGFTVEVDPAGDDGVFDSAGNELADLGPDAANLAAGTSLGTTLPPGFTVVTNSSGDLAVNDASGNEVGDLGIPGNPTATNPTIMTGSATPTQSQNPVMPPTAAPGTFALGTAVSIAILPCGLPAVPGVPTDPTGKYPLIPGLFFSKAGKPRLRGVPFDKNGIAHPSINRKTGHPRIPGVVFEADGSVRMAYSLLPNGFPDIAGIDVSAAGYPLLPNLTLAADGTLAPKQRHYRFQFGRPLFALGNNGFPLIPGVVFGKDGTVTFKKITLFTPGANASLLSGAVPTGPTLLQGHTSAVVPVSVSDMKDPILDDENGYQHDIVDQKTDVAKQRADAASTKDKQTKKDDAANIKADRKAIAADRKAVAADRTEAAKELRAARVASVVANTAVKVLQNAAKQPKQPKPPKQPKQPKQPKKTK